MKRNLTRLSVLAALVLVVGATGPARANLILNGAFQTGDLTSWTVFTVNNGSNGSGLPVVVSFDTTGGGAQNSAKFQVGRTATSGNPPAGAGGGLSQAFSTAGGTLNLSADVAADFPGNPGDANFSGGFFTLLLDGSAVDSFDVGFILANTTIRHHLSGTVTGVSAGTHTFAIQSTRPLLTGGSPLQYVTNLDVEAPAAVPEPSTLASTVIGVLMVLGYARRRAALRGRRPTVR